MSKSGLGLTGRRRHSRISFLPRVASEVVDHLHGSSSSSSTTTATTSGNSSSSNVRSSSHNDKDIYRLVIMGASKVGKTAITKRFLYDSFPPEHNPTVEELHRSEYEIKGIGTVSVEILDTSGTFSFPAMRRLAINSGSAFILVYAINDKESFDEVTQLREMISKTKGSVASSTSNNNTNANDGQTSESMSSSATYQNSSNGNSGDIRSNLSSPTVDHSSDSCENLCEPVQVPIVIAGNKIDLSPESRVISKEMAEFECIDWDVGFVECSAKNNDNITTIFQQLLLQAHLKGSLKVIAGPSTHYHQHSHHHNPWSLLTSGHHHNGNNHSSGNNNKDNHNLWNFYHSNNSSRLISSSTVTGETTQLSDLKKSESRRRSSLPVTDLFNYSLSLGGRQSHRSSPRKKRKSCTPS